MISGPLHLGYRIRTNQVGDEEEDVLLLFIRGRPAAPYGDAIAVGRCPCFWHSRVQVFCSNGEEADAVRPRAIWRSGRAGVGTALVVVSTGVLGMGARKLRRSCSRG